MPVIEPVVLQPEKVGLRHVGPRGQLWPGVPSPIASSAAVLAQTLYARWLPWLDLAESPDVVGGAYTLRLNDAGDFQIAVPNTTASDGFLWRSRFDPTGHLEWVEVYYEGELEGVFCIDTVNPTDSAGYSSTVDATDFCSSLWGNGAGIQTGSGGQLQDVVYDPPSMLTSLFDAQAWQDFSDAAFSSLLQGLLNSALGLRLSPWQHMAVSDPSSGGSVTVHGQDGAFLLKKAYERDITVVQSPRDVIERATQVWVPTIADNFPSSSSIVGSTLTTPTASWVITSGTGSSVVVQPNGGVVLSAGPSGGIFMQAAITSTVTIPATGTWRCLVTEISGKPTIAITESNGDEYQLGFGVATASTQLVEFWGGAIPINEGFQTTVIQNVEYTVTLESDGEWISAYVNAQLIGTMRRNHASTTSLATSVSVGSGGGLNRTVVSSVLVESLQPFLQRGADKGDYVLPGTASTYPSGGLHARYSNNADLQSDANALVKIHAPSRMQSYGAGAPAEYQNQQDAQVNSTATGTGPPQPGANTAGWWSVVWFGAIYLKLSAGNYTFQLDLGTNSNNAARLWIGKTRFGDQLVDQWSLSRSGNPYNFTVSASALAGSLPYGAGTVQRDGWYPIKIEYAVGNATLGFPALYMLTAPANYTDPGGTSITTGFNAAVPATSLSPLGCVDQRYQAISHFDLAQQTQQAFGYQMTVEPKLLESGLFPGVLAPRIREGQDTDAVLEPDKGARQDALLLFGPRQAFAWPLPGSLVKSRWRPGDGLRVQNQDVNIWDTQPRQILTFTRNFLPSGTASAQVSLAERPRTPARTLKQSLLGLTRSQRTYQKQLTTLSGNYVVGASLAAAGLSLYSQVMLQPSDDIVRAYVRCAWSAATAFGLTVNDIDVTTTLNGPWSTRPVSIDIGAVATTYAGFSQGLGLFVQTVNKSGATNTGPDFQLFVDCLR